MTVISSDSLLGYYNSQLTTSLTRKLSAATSTSSNGSTSSTSSSKTSLTSSSTLSTQQRDAKILSTTNYIDTSNVPASAVGDSGRREQDSQKLYSLYDAIDKLSYLAQMASRKDTPDGVIAGYNTRFQDCLSQIEDYVKKTTFNNLQLQQAAMSAVATATASLKSASYDYTGNTIATSKNINQDVSGLTSSDSFVISVAKNGATNNLTINMSDVAAKYGNLSLSNIVSYVNDTLKAGGYATRFSREETGEKTDDKGTTTYNYGIGISYATGESVKLSAASGSESDALYLSGTSGSTSSSTNTTTDKTTAADSTGRVVKLALSADGDTTSSVFSSNQTADNGTTTGLKSVTDINGNTYMIGTATGGISGQINQSDSQDVYISKYDSAGKLLWSQLIGSSAQAQGYGLALDPTGGVVVAGSTKSDLVKSSVADGNEDSFVAKFDSSGNETWVTQLATRSVNAATTVSVDASGNITVGGYTNSKINSEQTSAGNQDAYLITLSNVGKITGTDQFGTSGSDKVAATTYDNSGNLYVATVENGEAYISKYTPDAGGTIDITGTPTWKEDIGTISSSNAVSDLKVDTNGNVFVAGAVTSDSALKTDGSTSVNGSPSGNGDAFVYKIGQSADGTTPSRSALTYVGTSSKETAGTLAISSTGTVYLSGTTTGTFAGQTRQADNTNNAFITAINSTTGVADWTKQYGGTDGQSTGASVTLLENNSNVLDKLGLPTGAVQTEAYNNLLTDTSTLKAGDTLKIKVTSASSSRTVTVTIDPKETLNSLILKMNNNLGSAGKVSLSYASGARTLKFTANSGYALTLTDGSTDSDALAGLGMSSVTLSDGTLKTSVTKDSKKTYGLGLSSTMKFSTKTEAKAVKVQVDNVLSALKNIYQSLNNPSSSSTTSSTSSSASTASNAYGNLHSVDSSVALSLLA